MGRVGKYALMLGGGVVGFAVARHRRGVHSAEHAPGGVLVGNVPVYDRLTRSLLRSFFGRVADDVATVAPDGARVLDAGCGPGHLSLVLAGRHGLDVTGVDLDPQMIARARANTVARRSPVGDHEPTFLVGDVASLAEPDATFDVVVSTMAMHHWSDPVRGLAEIGRVLRPDGCALIWDLRPGVVPFHSSPPDPVEHAAGTGLRVVSATPWRWPGRLALTQRIELVHDDR
jgi:SAM-dependent methyltransferase